MVPLATNPVDAVWRDRPPAPAAAALPHTLDRAGAAAADKRRQIAETLRQRGEDGVMLTDPASIAWLLNLRGADVEFTPIALGFALLRADESVTLFMDPRKIPPETRQWLGNAVQFRTSARDLRRPSPDCPDRPSGWIAAAAGPRSGSRSGCGRPGRRSAPAPTPACCRRHARTRSSRRARARRIIATAWRWCRFLHWLATGTASAPPRARRRRGSMPAAPPRRCIAARAFRRSRDRGRTARSSITGSAPRPTAPCSPTRST